MTCLDFYEPTGKGQKIHLLQMDTVPVLYFNMQNLQTANWHDRDLDNIAILAQDKPNIETPLAQ